MFIFFFNDTATTEIYTLSLHDALPISQSHRAAAGVAEGFRHGLALPRVLRPVADEAARLAPLRADEELAVGALARSEEHTSELQSRQYLVCRLLLEKKKTHILPHLRLL